jgi:hypothetical protein
MPDTWIKATDEEPPCNIPLFVHGWRMLGQASPNGPYKKWMTTVGEFDDAGRCIDLLSPGCDCVTSTYLDSVTHWMPIPDPPKQ